MSEIPASIPIKPRALTMARKRRGGCEWSANERLGDLDRAFAAIAERTCSGRLNIAFIAFFTCT